MLMELPCKPDHLSEFTKQVVQRTDVCTTRLCKRWARIRYREQIWDAWWACVSTMLGRPSPTWLKSDCGWGAWVAFGVALGGFGCLFGVPWPDLGCLMGVRFNHVGSTLANMVEIGVRLGCLGHLWGALGASGMVLGCPCSAFEMALVLGSCAGGAGEQRQPFLSSCTGPHLGCRRMRHVIAIAV